MKKNIVIRILAALGGVTLWMLGLCALAETFFRVPLTGLAGRLLAAGTPAAVLIVLLLASALCAFGVCCLMMLSGKRASKRRGFVMQKGENGTIGVSVKSIEGLVMSCVQQHDMIARAEISVVERRDGIVVLLDIQEAAGVNIPVAVGGLQKQIKQYVSTCTGIDVQEVRVMVENTDGGAAESPYLVEKPVAMAAAVAAEVQPEGESVEPETETTVDNPSVAEIPAAVEPAQVIPQAEESPVQVEEPVVVESAMPAGAVPVVPPMMPEIMEEEDDRPLHQRLFGAEEQPVFVPAPPELMIESQAEEAQEIVADDAAEEPAEEAEEVAAEIDANAVLEVVEAIAAEEEIPAEVELADTDGFEYDEEVLAEEARLDGSVEETDDEIRE